MIKTSFHMEKIERIFTKKCKENGPYKADDIFCIKTDLSIWHFACDKPELVRLEDGQIEYKRLRKTIITELKYLVEDRHETKLIYLFFKYGRNKESVLRFRSQSLDNAFRVYREELDA